MHTVLCTFSESNMEKCLFFLPPACCHPSTTKAPVRMWCGGLRGFCSTDECIVLLLPSASVPLWDGNDLLPATSSVCQRLICHKIGSELRPELDLLKKPTRPRPREDAFNYSWDPGLWWKVRGGSRWLVEKHHRSDSREWRWWKFNDARWPCLISTLKWIVMCQFCTRGSYF